MIAPPRNIELLLASLGAEGHFRDAVVGDLAEEFAQRADRDGLAAARRWYYREAVRAAPHLTYNSLCARGLKGLARSMGIIVTAFTIALMAIIPPFAIIAGLAFRLGAPKPWNVSADHLAFGFAVVLGVAFNAALPLFAGYVAAYLDAEAPLVTAAMLGIVWLSVVLTADAIRVAAGGPPATSTSTPPPFWLVYVMFAAVAIGPIIGGILRVRTHRPIPS